MKKEAIVHLSITKLLRPLVVGLAVASASIVLAAPAALADSRGVAPQFGTPHKETVSKGKKVATRAAGDDAVALSGPFKFKPVAPGSDIHFELVFGNSGSNAWTGSGGYAIMELVSGGSLPIAGSGCDPILPGEACVIPLVGHVANTPGPWKAVAFFSMAHGAEPFGQKIKVKVVGP
jgi:hypothetical protein